MGGVGADVDVPGDVFRLERLDVARGGARCQLVQQLGVRLAGQGGGGDARQAVVDRDGDRRDRRRRGEAGCARTKDDDSEGEVQQSLHAGH
jgi:hypothetical protein